MRWLTVVSICGFSAFTLGCGQASLSGGTSWVADMPSPVSDESAGYRVISAEEEEALYQSPFRSEPRPRLHEVTTLGEIDLPSSTPKMVDPPAPQVVHVENNVSATSSIFVPMRPAWGRNNFGSRTSDFGNRTWDKRRRASAPPSKPSPPVAPPAPQVPSASTGSKSSTSGGTLYRLPLAPVRTSD